jgi:hypothetical protein
MVVVVWENVSESFLVNEIFVGLHGEKIDIIVLVCGKHRN